MPEAIAADSVYMLMFPGWKTEFRSNRWHYASRWAQHLPVTLVQTWPDTARLDADAEDEPRIPGCRILQIAANPEPDASALRGLLQTRQLLDDMMRQGYRRPILWAYDPGFMEAYALLPAALRIYHASENYFQFPDVSRRFLDRLSGMVAASDLVIAVSPGVAASYGQVARCTVETVTNGCDYGFYAGALPDAALAEAGRSFDRIVIYAGNINDRLDYQLLNRLAEAYPQSLFALFGQVTRLDAADAAQWQQLLRRQNVRSFGAVPAERLPGLYAAAHLGLAPYKMRPDLVGNLFPLKIFEMLAGGLPVVSTPFSALRDKACTALALAGDDATFVAKAGLDRRRLSPQDRQDADRLCRQEDYAGKFDAVRRMAETRLPAAVTAPGAQPLGLADADMLAAWLRDIPQAVRQAEPDAALLLSRLAALARRRASDVAARHLPAPLRRALRLLLSSRS